MKTLEKQVLALEQRIEMLEKLVLNLPSPPIPNQNWYPQLVPTPMIEYPNSNPSPWGPPYVVTCKTDKDVAK